MPVILHVIKSQYFLWQIAVSQKIFLQFAVLLTLQHVGHFSKKESSGLMQHDLILCEEFSSTHSWSCGDEKQAHALKSGPRCATLGDAEFPARRRQKRKGHLVVLAEFYWCFSVMLFLASSWLVTQRLVLTWGKSESEQTLFLSYLFHWNSTNYYRVDLALEKTEKQVRSDLPTWDASTRGCKIFGEQCHLKQNDNNNNRSAQGCRN